MTGFENSRDIQPDPPAAGLPLPVVEEEKVEEEEGGARRRLVAGRKRLRLPNIPAVRIRPFRLIVILAIVIFILLLLILHFGLGGGGGSLLPGTSESTGSAFQEEPSPVKPDESEKPSVRRELNVSFFPSASDPDTARELTCNLDWTDIATESQESRRIATENMIDFEFELEKAIRNWRTSLGTGDTQDVPVVAVGMSPFPGEGVFRKIEGIAHRIDPRISILRLESSVRDEKP